jgi:uncharacterized membrane protein
MPDTGAPWNIPYADPTDLVRDWPALSEDVAEAVRDGLNTAFLFKQIVQTVKTDVFSTTSTSFTGVTGLTVTITPTSATSKVLVLVGLETSADSSSSNTEATMRLVRGGTGIGGGTAVGNRSSSFAGLRVETFPITKNHFFHYLDSPGVATATTYGVEMRTQGTTMYVGRTMGDSDIAQVGRSSSVITAIEVAA